MQFISSAGCWREIRNLKSRCSVYIPRSKCFSGVVESERVRTRRRLEFICSLSLLQHGSNDCDKKNRIKWWLALLCNFGGELSAFQICVSHLFIGILFKYCLNFTPLCVERHPQKISYYICNCISLCSITMANSKCGQSFAACYATVLFIKVLAGVLKFSFHVESFHK